VDPHPGTQTRGPGDPDPNVIQLLGNVMVCCCVAIQLQGLDSSCVQGSEGWPRPALRRATNPNKQLYTHNGLQKEGSPDQQRPFYEREQCRVTAREQCRIFEQHKLCCFRTRTYRVLARAVNFKKHSQNTHTQCDDFELEGCLALEQKPCLDSECLQCVFRTKLSCS